MLIACAIQKGKLISLGLHTKLMFPQQGKEYDDELKEVLGRYNLEDKVEFIVADSKYYDNTHLKADFIFIDGDHTYQGVKRDYFHWIEGVKIGGHILFHDATATRKYATFHAGANRLIEELHTTPTLERKYKIGSLVHFVKIK